MKEYKHINKFRHYINRFILTAITGIMVNFIMLFPSMAQGVPSWLEDVPEMTNYYLGIGYSKKVPDQNHIDKARIDALSNISNEISIEIVNTQSLRITENETGIVDEFYSYSSSTFTNKELSGYELVDTYENKKEYWAFYRLSKEKYRSFKTIEAQSLLEELEANLDLMDSFVEDGLYMNAVNIAINSLKKIENNIDAITFLNSPHTIHEVTFLKRIKKAINELNRSLQIKLNTNEELDELSRGDHISIELYNKSQTYNLNNIPLDLIVTSNNFEYSISGVTDKSGVVYARLPSYLFDSDILDFETFVNYGENIDLAGYEATKQILKLYFNKGEQFYLSVKPLRIYIDATEDFGVINNMSGYRIVEGNDYDFKLQLEVEANYIGEKFGIHTHRGRANLSVYNHENIKIKSILIENVIGRHTNIKISKRESLDNVQDKILESIRANAHEMFY